MKKTIMFSFAMCMTILLFCTVACDMTNTEPVEYPAVDESYVEELYGRLCGSVPFEEATTVGNILYSGKKVTTSDLSDADKRLFVWKAYIEGFEGLEGYASGDYSGIDYELTYYDYHASLFDERIKSLFGPDASVPDETFSLSGYIALYDPDKEVYYCTENAVWTEYCGQQWSKMTGYEQSGEYLYIYDKFLYFYYGDSDNLAEMMYDFGKIDIAAYGSTVTEGQSPVTPELHFDDFYSFSANNEPLEQYGIRYKHTFRRADDGTYYWISSEPAE